MRMALCFRMQMALCYPTCVDVQALDVQGLVSACTDIPIAAFWSLVDVHGVGERDWLSIGGLQTFVNFSEPHECCP